MKYYEHRLVKLLEERKFRMKNPQNLIIIENIDDLIVNNWYKYIKIKDNDPDSDVTPRNGFVVGIDRELDKITL